MRSGIKSKNTTSVKKLNLVKKSESALSNPNESNKKSKNGKSNFSPRPHHEENLFDFTPQPENIKI